MILLTNFHSRQLPSYKTAIAIYAEIDPSARLEIGVNARDINGNPVLDCLSLSSNKKWSEVDDFWTIFKIIDGRRL